MSFVGDFYRFCRRVVGSVEVGEESREEEFDDDDDDDVKRPEEAGDTALLFVLRSGWVVTFSVSAYW